MFHLIPEDERKRIEQQAYKEAFEEGYKEGQEIVRNALGKVISFCKQYGHYESTTPTQGWGLEMNF